MNQTESSPGHAGSVLAAVSLLCSFPVVAISLWLAIAGTPQTDEQMAMNYLVGFMGTIATVLLSLPALVFGVAGLFVRRSAVTWVAFAFSLVPIGILVTAIYAIFGAQGIDASNRSAKNQQVRYSYEVLGKEPDGSVTRVRGGSGSRRVRDGVDAAKPIRNGNVQWTVQGANDDHATFRIYWPDDSTDDVDVELGEELELWASSGQSGVRLTVDELNDKIAAIENILAESGDEGGDPVYALVRALETQEHGISRDAARQLQRMGEGSAAVPILVDLLQSDERQTRIRAANCLSTLGDQARAAVPALVEALGDESPAVQESAATALGTIGSAAKPAIPQLRALLGTQRISDRNHLEWVIRTIGPVDQAEIPGLLAALESEADRLRVAHEARADARVPQLSALLADEELGVRRRASLEAAKLGSKAVGATPALATALRDANRDVRIQSARALGQIGEDAQDAVPALNEALKDESPLVRAAAARALGMIGIQDDDTVTHLEAALEDLIPVVRVRAAVALWRLTGDSSSSIPGLINMLSKDQARQVKFDATQALNEIGVGAVAPLIEALQDPATQGGAQEALVQIGSPAIPQLIDALRDSGRTGASSMVSLVMIGADALPALTEALNNEDPKVRSGVARALAHFRRFPEQAATALTAALADHDALVRRAAAQSLGQLGRRSESALPALMEVLDDEDPFVRVSAALAIDKISPDRKGSEPRIFVELENEKRRKKLQDAYSLTRSKRVDEAIEVYQQILKDNPSVTAHYGLARALQIGGRWDEARSEFELVLQQLEETDTDDPLQLVSKFEPPGFAITDVYMNLAKVERSSDRVESERSVWQEFASMLESKPLPDKPRYLGRLAEAYYHLGRYADSRAVLENELQILGESEPGTRGGLRWWYLTLILARQRETDLARLYYEQLISTGTTENVLVFELQAELEEILNRPVEAVQKTEESSETDERSKSPE